MHSAPFILVDGSSYLFRAFHALPPLTTASGQPTGAIKGVVNMLQKLLNTYQPTQIAVIFDAKGPTFRHELYSEYKANRPPMPDDLRIQIEPLHQLIKAMGLPLVVVEGVEADDVIGTLAAKASEEGVDTLISTGDKDMAQLVNQHVTLFNSMNDALLDVAGVEAKFGVPPELIIDFLALMGDKSDNIPGAPGVGEKTALKLLQGIGGIDALYARSDEIAALSFRGAKTMAKKLLDHQEQIQLSYELATIKCDVELPFQLSDLMIQPHDEPVLRKMYEELQFTGLLKNLDNQEAESDETGVPESPAIEFDIVLDQSQLADWIGLIKSAKVLALDTETTSINYMDAELVGLSLALIENSGQERAAYIPVAHDYTGAPEQLSLEYVLAELVPALTEPSLKLIGQNLKYDASVLAKYGVELPNITFDTMLESYVLNSTASRHDLDTLANKYLNHTNISFEDVAGKGKDQLTFNQVELDIAAEYAVEDAVICLRLHQHFIDQLEKEPGLLSVFETVEMPLLLILARMERNGAMIDSQLLLEQSKELVDRMMLLERAIHELAGEVFNIGSPKQLAEILYEKMALPVIKKTPKGAPSTAEPVLQELSHDFPMPKMILEYRSYSKLKSTYTEKLPKLARLDTGRVHTSYHQAVTATGRLSSSDPNLQNIPIRTEEGRRIRQAFIAPEGRQLLAADYSQIELRIMAHLSKDEGLVQAFNEGKDIHSATAAEVFHVPLDEVSADHRRSAKAINFGLIYGMSAFGLGKQLGIGRNEAQGYIDLYFDRYPGVKQYMDEIRASAHDIGYVETLFGRRLYLPEINSRNKQRQQAAERTAINAPMQGTAADIIKRAMIEIDPWLQSLDNGSLMIMQVHDELVFEVPREFVEVVKAGVIERMEGAAQLSVPLIVDAGVGENWDQAH